MREKLIELLNIELCPIVCVGSECKYFNSERCYDEKLADHLIANGVTARQHGEWKAVECGTMCTNCKRVFDHHFEISRHVCVKLRKCPDCGADMRGGT